MHVAETKMNVFCNRPSRDYLAVSKMFLFVFRTRMLAITCGYCKAISIVTYIRKLA